MSVEAAEGLKASVSVFVGLAETLGPVPCKLDGQDADGCLDAQVDANDLEPSLGINIILL